LFYQLSDGRFPILQIYVHVGITIERIVFDHTTEETSGTQLPPRQERSARSPNGLI
jgi:hypothetical protein